MLRKRIRSLAMAATLSASLLASMACGPEAPGPFGLLLGALLLPQLAPEAFESQTVVGGSGDIAVIGEYSLPIPDDPFAPVLPLPQLRISVTNLNTLEVNVLEVEGLAYASNLASDGRLLAGVDFEQQHIAVLDLQNGVETHLFQGLVTNQGNRIHGVAGLQWPYVVMTTSPPDFSAAELLVVNLDTGERQSISPASPVSVYTSDGNPNAVAIRDDLLVAHLSVPRPPNWKHGDPFDDRTTIDVVDLTTGERRTLVDDAGDYGDSGLVIADDRVLHLSTPYDLETGAGRTTLRAYSLDGQSAETLLDLGDLSGESEFHPDEPPTTETRFSRVIGFSDHGVLQESTIRNLQSADTFFAPPRFVFEFVALDGTTMIAADFNLGLLEFSTRPLPGLVGRHVLYRDPKTFETVAFDVTTRTESRFDPFGP